MPIAKSRFKESLDFLLGGEALILRIAFSALMVATVAKMVSLEFSTLIGEREWFNSLLQVAGVAGGVIIALISLFVALLSQRTHKLGWLKSRVRIAYEKALDESDFNPARQRNLTDGQPAD